MTKLTFALSVLSISVASSFAQAAEPGDMSQATDINQSPTEQLKNPPTQKMSGFYIGGTVGTGKLYITRDNELYDSDNSDIVDNAKSIAKKDSSSSAQSFQLLAGYQFNRIVAIEMTYERYTNDIHFRGFKLYNTSSSKPRYRSQQVEAKPFVYNLQANVGYTFANGIRPFMLSGLGLLHLSADQDVYSGDFSSSVFSLRLGTGVEYTPATLKGVTFRASWTGDLAYMDIEKEPDNIVTAIVPDNFSDINLLSSVNLGATYKF